MTEGDRVVAELIPPRPSRSPVLTDSRLAEAVRKGWITPPLTTQEEPPPRFPVMPIERLLKELAQDRSEK